MSVGVIVGNYRENYTSVVQENLMDQAGEPPVNVSGAEFSRVISPTWKNARVPCHDTRQLQVSASVRDVGQIAWLSEIATQPF